MFLRSTSGIRVHVGEGGGEVIITFGISEAPPFNRRIADSWVCEVTIGVADGHDSRPDGNVIAEGHRPVHVLLHDIQDVLLMNY